MTRLGHMLSPNPSQWAGEYSTLAGQGHAPPSPQAVVRSASPTPCGWRLVAPAEAERADTKQASASSLRGLHLRLC